MPEAKPIKTNFSAGELSRSAAGRVDVEKYHNGAELIENFIVGLQGPLFRRSGFEHIGSCYVPDKKVRIIPFVFSSDDARLLEFGDDYVSIWDEGVLIATIQGTGIFEDMLRDFSYEQSLDILYLAHGDIHPKTLSRTALAGSTTPEQWEYADYPYVVPPFLSSLETPVGVTLAANQTIDRRTLTSTQDDFNGASVGDYVEFPLQNKLALGRIVEVVDNATVIVTTQEDKCFVLPDEVYVVTNPAPTATDITLSHSFILTTAMLNGFFKVTEADDSDEYWFRLDHIAGDEGRAAKGAVITPVTCLGSIFASDRTVVGSIDCPTGVFDSDDLGRHLRLHFDEKVVVAKINSITELVAGSYVAKHVQEAGTQYLHSNQMACGPDTPVTPTFWIKKDASFAATAIGIVFRCYNVGGSNIYTVTREIDIADLEETYKEFSDYFLSPISPAGTVGVVVGVYATDQTAGTLFVGRADCDIDGDNSLLLNGDFSDGDQDWSKGTDWTIVSDAGNAYDPGDTAVTTRLSVTFNNAIPNDSFLYTGASQASTLDWRLGAWWTGNYPWVVTFLEQRLLYAGSNYEPNAVWLSVTGDFYDFSTVDSESQVLDSSGINHLIDSGQFNRIRWVIPGRVPMLGTDGDEFRIGTDAQLSQITPRNFRITHESDFGSMAVPPKKVGGSIIFAQSGSSVIRRMAYNFQLDVYDSVQINALSDHIIRDGGICLDMAQSMSPEPLVFFVRGDGQLVCLTYAEDQQFTAFARIIHGGPEAMIESVAVLPSDVGYDLYAVVKRETYPESGTYTRSIEKLHPLFRPEDETDRDGMLFLDSASSFSGNQGDSKTFPHLANCTVTPVLDGAKQTPVTLDAYGDYTLPSDVAEGWIGFSYRSKVRTVVLDSQGLGAVSSQGTVRRVGSVVVRVMDSLGFTYGPVDGPYSTCSFRDTTTPLGELPPFRTEDFEVNIEGRHTFRPQFEIIQDEPYPLNILALFPQLKLH